MMYTVLYPTTVVRLLPGKKLSINYRYFVTRHMIKLVAVVNVRPVRVGSGGVARDTRTAHEPPPGWRWKPQTIGSTRRSSNFAHSIAPTGCYPRSPRRHPMPVTSLPVACLLLRGDSSNSFCDWGCPVTQIT